MNKEYYFYIHQNVTVLTVEGNCIGQLDSWITAISLFMVSGSY